MPVKKDCSFFLKNANSPTPTSIIFSMRIPGQKKPLRRSIGELILPGNWDLEEQRAKGNNKAAREINQVIESIVNMLPGVKSECRRNNRVITSADVNAALDVILQDKRLDEEAVPGDMLADFKTIIAGMKDGSILTPGKNKKKYTAATIKNYEVRCYGKVSAFLKEKKEPATWAGVDLELYELFIAWCHEQDLSNNSIGVYIKCWKRMGKIALKKGWHSNPVFNDEDFMALKEETPDIYLDVDKIAMIHKQPVPLEVYDIARDWFVLDCFLGLRVSDLQRVAIKDFSGKHFEFVNQKTGAHVAIPIHPYCKAIIKKWKGLPPPMSDQYINTNIKIVAKMAKLNAKFIYTITKGGLLKKFELQEWEMVSNHTARRSFITNLLKLGIPHAQVMRLAGIKRYETLMRYFKQTAGEIADETGKHDFFQ